MKLMDDGLTLPTGKSSGNMNREGGGLTIGVVVERVDHGSGSEQG